MTDSHSCPLCTEPYDDRNALCVHLEVEHRKSEVVSYLVDLDAAVPEPDISSDSETAVEDERTAPSA